MGDFASAIVKTVDTANHEVRIRPYLENELLHLVMFQHGDVGLRLIFPTQSCPVEWTQGDPGMINFKLAVVGGKRRSSRKRKGRQRNSRR